MRPEDHPDIKGRFRSAPVRSSYFDKVKYPFFCWAKWKENESNPATRVGTGFWFRIFGYGLHFTNGRLNFSERNGFQKPLKLPFGWRVKTLKRHEY